MKLTARELANVLIGKSLSLVAIPETQMLAIDHNGHPEPGTLSHCSVKSVVNEIPTTTAKL